MTPSDADVIPEVSTLDVETLRPGTSGRRWLRLGSDALGRALSLPVLLARGAQPGPVVGVVAGVHGDELNGVAVIHRLFQTLDPEALEGTVIGVPVINLPGYLNRSRFIAEGQDLNRLMPGRPHGRIGEQFAFRVRTQLIERFDYLVDLHTAGSRRINSLYVRADLDHAVVRRMATSLAPEIVVHVPASSATVRGAATASGIPAITVEIGDPQRIQTPKVEACTRGVRALLAELGVAAATRGPARDPDPVVCARSRWLFAAHGGLVEVLPEVCEIVARGCLLARVTNLFGDVVATYSSPERAIVVGKSTDPVCEPGARLVHLGFEGPAPG